MGKYFPLLANKHHENLFGVGSTLYTIRTLVNRQPSPRVSDTPGPLSLPVYRDFGIQIPEKKLQIEEHERGNLRWCKTVAYMGKMSL